jgi:hypothetical protein
MENFIVPALAGGGGFSLVGYLALQWRLNKRDERKHKLRMAMLAANPEAPVLWRTPSCVGLSVKCRCCFGDAPIEN